MRADAAEDAEHALDEQRRLHEALGEEVPRRVQVADVVALDLEARAVLRARRQDLRDVLERVLEDAIVRPGEVFALPIVLERLVRPEHREQAEVHRAHVERRDLGLELERGTQALVDRHRRRAAGREVQDDVRALPDVGGELLEQRRDPASGARRPGRARAGGRSRRPPRPRRPRRPRSPSA
jgi:hypothetical protein